MQRARTPPLFPRSPAKPRQTRLAFGCIQGDGVGVVFVFLVQPRAARLISIHGHRRERVNFGRQPRGLKGNSKFPPAQSDADFN